VTARISTVFRQLSGLNELWLPHCKREIQGCRMEERPEQGRKKSRSDMTETNWKAVYLQYVGNWFEGNCSRVTHLQSHSRPVEICSLFVNDFQIVDKRINRFVVCLPTMSAECSTVEDRMLELLLGICVLIKWWRQHKFWRP